MNDGFQIKRSGVSTDIIMKYGDQTIEATGGSPNISFLLSPGTEGTNGNFSFGNTNNATQFVTTQVKG